MTTLTCAYDPALHEAGVRAQSLSGVIVQSVMSLGSELDQVLSSDWGQKLGLSLGLGQGSVSIQGQDQEEDQGRGCLEPLGSESKSVSLLRFSSPSQSPKVIFFP